MFKVFGTFFGCVILLAVSLSDCAAHQPASSDSTASVIRTIRGEYAAINAAIQAKKLQVTTKDLEGLSTEGGEMRKYFEGKELRKTVIEVFGETGKWLTEYYYVHGELFFCYSADTKYTKSIAVEGNRIRAVEQNRYYFEHGKMIRWINPAGKIVSAIRYSKKTKELLDELKDAEQNKEN